MKYLGSARGMARGLFGRLLLLGSVVATTMSQVAPVPFLEQPLVPTTAAPGTTDLSLVVNGSGFVSGASITWNGVSLATKVASGSQLSATVPAADLAQAGSATVAVSSGGNSSNSVLFPVASSLSVVSFLGSDYGGPTFPEAAVIGDFNADGVGDVAVTESNGIDIFVGRGDGSFQAPVLIPYPNQPLGIVAGDFNHDGKTDLAFTLSSGTSVVDVVLGNGDGTFQSPNEYSVGGLTLSAIVTGDLNNDGYLDIVVSSVVANPGSDMQVTVLLGNGDGTFQPGLFSTTPGDRFGVVVGDFNQDGFLDLAIPYVAAKTSGVSILAGKGDGTFQPAVNYPVGGTPTGGIVAADLNGDGRLDLALPISKGVSVILGNGDGSFQKPSVYGAGNTSQQIAVADMNDDGKLDLVVDSVATAKISVLLGNGNGSFANPAQFSVASATLPPVVGDFNQDGRLDIALPVFQQGLSVLLQTTGPLATFSANSLSFPTQAVKRTSAAQVATLTNTGVSPLTISSIALDDADFVYTTTCPLTPATLAAGAKCTLRVSSSPQSKGAHTGTITITDDAPGSPQKISLSGTGTLLLVPSTVAFGTVKVGTSNNLPLLLTNLSTSAIKILSVSQIGAPFSDSNPCTGTLAANASCTVTVFFNPSVAGTFTTQISIGENAGGSPLTVSVTGTAQ